MIVNVLNPLQGTVHKRRHKIVDLQPPPLVRKCPNWLNHPLPLSSAGTPYISKNSKSNKMQGIKKSPEHKKLLISNLREVLQAGGVKNFFGQWTRIN